MLKLQLFHALWGMTGTLSEKLYRAKDHGYAGIEAPLPSQEERSEFIELIDQLQLSFIPQIFTAAGRHEESFQEQVEQAKTYRPLFINAHSGKDYMSEEEQARFFEFALRVEKEAGIQVAHETHRGRILFTPKATARNLLLFPELKVTADFSHFTCVCESLLQDQQEELTLIKSRALHVHGRVGFEEGPQVPHPAAPEFARYLEQFEQWWDDILNNPLIASQPNATFTPEFGPPGYMPTIPFTQQPIADLFQVNHWIGERIRTKYTI
ncbi:sugar phosphate isomerase/epimerase family protein [Paenibacillus roseipurpureus]|uniref:Sugar phosphate isomerase/epimerase n=1 Tax=Paenibacillus roseopurpureus TaxID=2918901 RepID=A0AA96LQ43_9BACL|nr:sugar phosphate isomerase/epimerase [Paenibacillus sp. MBLB1832]WNR46202.1 sugar phosphate isomerase/epimerase [Paenibacillus sp. MBLB1832]